MPSLSVRPELVAHSPFSRKRKHESMKTTIYEVEGSGDNFTVNKLRDARHTYELNAAVQGAATAWHFQAPLGDMTFVSPVAIPEDKQHLAICMVMDQQLTVQRRINAMLWIVLTIILVVIGLLWGYGKHMGAL
jgi:hypothetical protein